MFFMEHPTFAPIAIAVVLLALTNPRRAVALVLLAPFLPLLAVRATAASIVLFCDWCIDGRPWTRLLMKAMSKLGYLS